MKYLLYLWEDNNEMKENDYFFDEKSKWKQKEKEKENKFLQNF